MSGRISCGLALSVLLTAFPALPVVRRDAPPSAAEVNDAISRSEDYAGTVVSRVRGCVPLTSEDGLVDRRFVDWYCIADGTPLPAGERVIEFAIRRDHGPRRFEMIIGEFGGGCPPAANVAHDLQKRVTVPNVTGLGRENRPMMGSMIFDDDPEAMISIACDYYGKAAGNNYRLSVTFTFDAEGYHLQNGASEQLFDNAGNPVDHAH